MPWAFYSFANGKGSVMVKRFFSSIGRLATMVFVLCVSFYGAAQPFVGIPHKGEINEWIVFGFSVLIIWNIRDFAHDLGFWCDQVKKSYRGQE
jgi:hypothetical protein